MGQQINAIYEDGVLKPLEPLKLAEHQRVRVSVAPELPDLAEAVALQRQALNELDGELASLPDRSPDDGLTAADHDSILYGRTA